MEIVFLLERFLTELQSLMLENFVFSGTMPSELGKMTELRNLDLSRNDLTPEACQQNSDC